MIQSVEKHFEKLGKHPAKGKGKGDTVSLDYIAGQARGSFMEDDVNMTKNGGSPGVAQGQNTKSAKSGKAKGKSKDKGKGQPKGTPKGKAKGADGKGGPKGGKLGSANKGKGKNPKGGKGK